jgi:hypothetical protein
MSYFLLELACWLTYGDNFCQHSMADDKQNTKHSQKDLEAQQVPASPHCEANNEPACCSTSLW